MSRKTEIEYTVQVWQEGEQFVAHAMPLDVMSCGPTPELASQALREAVELYLVTAGETGALGEVLEEAGYRPSSFQRSNVQTFQPSTMSDIAIRVEHLSKHVAI